MLHTEAALRRGVLFRVLPLLGLGLFGCVGDAAERNLEDKTVWITIPADAEHIVKEVAPEVSLDIEALPGGADVPLRLVGVKESRIEEISRAMHHETHRCGGFTAFDDRERALNDFAWIGPGARTVPSYELDNAETASALVAAVDEEHIRATIEGLSSFPSRYYQSQSSVEASNWLRDRWQEYIGERTDARAELWEHASWKQPSVILTIDGVEKPQEVVVIGGHLDSISFWGGSAPGADDDASGVATLGEVARVVLENGVRPSRTIKFMAYAAEEAGLRGSREIADKFADDGIDVVGVVQLDMVNYKWSAKDIYFLSDYTSAEQTTFMKELVDTYLPELEWGTTSCGYACSDHASWNRNGYRASTPFESTKNGMNNNLHTPSDTLANMGGDAHHAAKFARLGAAYVAELAGGVIPPAPGTPENPAR